jgi:hypothetical protein
VSVDAIHGADRSRNDYEQHGKRENRLDHAARNLADPTTARQWWGIDRVPLPLRPLCRSRHWPTGDRDPLRWPGDGHPRELQRGPDEPYHPGLVHRRLRVLSQTVHHFFFFFLSVSPIKKYECFFFRGGSSNEENWVAVETVVIQGDRSGVVRPG